MILYKVQENLHNDVNTQIKAMSTVIAGIAPTLQSLQTVLAKHKDTISSPSIEEFRNELQMMINNATTLSQNISVGTQKLVDVSEQAGRHMVSIEQHYGAILKSNKLQ